ncbi:MAG: PepSY domain-containing protein [Rhodocyclaceae bacterium]|nr:PepSY domain-containing protein [Rhodocyclaceae bacterium]
MTSRSDHHETQNLSNRTCCAFRNRHWHCLCRQGDGERLLAIESAKVSLNQAVTAAEQQVGGKASRAEFEKHKGQWVFDVEVVNGNKVMDVRMDPTSGMVIAATEDKPIATMTMTRPIDRHSHRRDAWRHRRPGFRPEPKPVTLELCGEPKMKTLTRDSAMQMLNKVPEVTLYFWVIKIMATTVDETGADFLNVDLNFGLTGTSIVMGALLGVFLFLQMRARKHSRGCTGERGADQHRRHAHHGQSGG